jgi:hydrocephalus-inducing protein
MKSIRWVKNVQSGHSRPTTQENGSHGENADTTGLQSKASAPAVIPAKKKVIETEPEPPHSDVENSSREVELFISAIADFAKYECPIREVNFRETVMYQTRVYSFTVKNTGLIVLSYQWAIVDSDGSPITPHSSQLHLDSEGSVMSEGGEMVPFSVSPMSGMIGVGEEALFTMRYSPLDVMERQCTFRCK